MSMDRLTPIDIEAITNAVFEIGLRKLRVQSPTLHTMVCQHRQAVANAIKGLREQSMTPAYKAAVKQAQNQVSPSLRMQAD